MKRCLSLVLVIMLLVSLPVFAENIDLMNMSIEQLEALRSEIDTALASLRIKDGADYVAIDDYEEYTINAPAHIGEKVSVYGKVVQVAASGSDAAYRIALNDDYSCMFYVNFENVPSSLRVVEDSFVTVYGKFIGDWTYDSILFSSVTVPGIEADNIVTGIVKPVINPDFAGTREEPIPVGEVARFPGVRYFNEAVVDFKVSKVVRGKKALEIVKGFNRYNDSPSKGKEYVVLTLDVSVVSAKSGKASLSDYYFKFVNESGIEYESVYVIDVKPALTDMYTGASQSVYLVGVVDVKDNPLLVYDAGSEFQIWFGPLTTKK